MLYDRTWKLPAWVMYLTPLNGLYFCGRTRAGQGKNNAVSATRGRGGERGRGGGGYNWLGGGFTSKRNHYGCLLERGPHKEWYLHSSEVWQVAPAGTRGGGVACVPRQTRRVG